jgi:DNA-binding NarL/FixJ family response regulator
VIRVLLVDDQPLVRAGLSRILGPEVDLEIVGECADGDEVEAAVVELRPDVVLMDVRMKRVDGAEATRRLRARAGAPPVLVLTTFDDDATVAAALSAGADGFVLKDAPGEDLVRATRVVAGGGGWLDPAIAPGVLATYRASSLPRAAAAAKVGDLTEREIGVLRLVARGATNAEIAAALVIGEATVKSHIGHIFTKLGFRDRAAAIVFAFDHGLVIPGVEEGDPPAGR